MHVIEITHNPFTVDTTFLFNGNIPAYGCKLSSYRETRLQLWVESLFDELAELFNGDNNYKVIFKGVESDYLDVVEAAQKAIAEKGMQVEVKWKPVQPTEKRLEQIKELVDQVKENPDFKVYLEENDEVRTRLEEAFNRDFDVYVVATMSSGKSTLINAMLGADLLPAANEATTATIARITDNGSMKEGVFSAKRFDSESQLVDQVDEVDAEILKEWNICPKTKLIDIEGNIQAIEERDDVRLVLTDTPGPNNSQDIEHRRTTMGFIQDSNRNPLILYVLNATQLGTNDDKNLLGLVAEIMRKGGKQSKDRFIFVVNKMDMFDPEKGENVGNALIQMKKYLKANGIDNPHIYPVSAYFTHLLRKPSDQHTRKERGDMRSLADLFEEEDSMDMMQYMSLTSRVKENLKSKNYSTLFLRSGLPAVEAMIDEYIDKYNLPHRLKRAYDALSQVIDRGLNEADLIRQLDQDEKQLRYLEEEIQALQQRQKKGFDVAAYKDKVEREGKALPASTESALIDLESAINPILQEIAKRFTDSEVSVSVAENRLAEAEKDLETQYLILINEYEKVFISTQEIIYKDLKDEYQRYVTELFDDNKKLELSTLEGVRKSVGSISFNLNLNKKEIKEKDILIDTEEVSTSKWYKPWTWGDTETVYTYGKEEYLNLEELWKKRSLLVEREFIYLLNNARDRIDEGKNKLIESYLLFMEEEFNIQFNKIMESLKEKINDQNIRLEAINLARNQKKWIEEIQMKLDGTLAI